MTQIVDLRCEYFTNPIGVDDASPRLSWKLQGDRAGIAQKAYRVVVASSRDRIDSPDLWDSGTVFSHRSYAISYGGRAIPAQTEVFWRTIVTDDLGAECQSEISTWETGLGEDASTSIGRWIAGDLVGGKRTSVPCPLLRREFNVTAPVQRARLYATALGLYETDINGSRVGDDYLTPGWTDYRKRVRYQAYDVTSMIQEGLNCWSASLGDGWWCGNVEWRGRQLYGEKPMFAGLLVLDLEDGSRQTIATDADWHYGYGPVLVADLYMGEQRDARLDLSGWKNAGFDASLWRSALIESPTVGPLVWQASPPVRSVIEIQPISVKKIPKWPKPDFVYDFAQNMVGRVRIKFRGEAGTHVRLRFAERVKADGTLYTENLRTALQTDHYTLRGDVDGEVFETSFTFHGFQYMDISGLEEGLSVEDISGIVMHSDYRTDGQFECSDPLWNRLHLNALWGWRGNTVDVPTDCPQRDERLGWTGDAQVFCGTSLYLSDSITFWEKYVQDLEDSQREDGAIPPIAPNTEVVGGDGGPAWADAMVIVPWKVYLATGDCTILERHFGAMRRFVGFLESTSKDYIRCYPGYEGFQGFGDWLSINADTPHDLIGTAFFAHVARLLSKIASVLSRTEEANELAALSENVRKAFLHRYVTPSGVIASGTQTAYLLACQFDLLPAEIRPVAVQAIVDDVRRRGTHLSAGFVGSSYLNPVLSDGGRWDVAFDLMNQHSWPSWLYAVTQGATTIWERWDGWTHDKGYQDAGMNSFNHYAYGAIVEWLYARVAGIDVDESAPGFGHIRFRPQFGGGLSFARGHVQTPHGLAECSWKVEAGVWSVEVIVPPNACGTLEMPLGVDDCETKELGPGTHRFTANMV